MPKLYAEDLIKMEELLEKLTAERKEIEAKPAIVRRLKKDQISEIDSKIYQLHWQISSGKEEVFADPTSSAIYEAQQETRRNREKAGQVSAGLPEAQRGLPEERGTLPLRKEADKLSLIASMKKSKPKSIGEKTLEYAKLLEQEREPE